MPSDIIAGLVLLRQRQRAKRNAVLDEVSARPLSRCRPTPPSAQAAPCCTPLPLLLLPLAPGFACLWGPGSHPLVLSPLSSPARSCSHHLWLWLEPPSSLGPRVATSQPGPHKGLLSTGANAGCKGCSLCPRLSVPPTPRPTTHQSQPASPSISHKICPPRPGLGMSPVKVGDGFSSGREATSNM